jgi:protein-S-isoprenylcysteine O-methyltransferase Ste14
MLLRIYLPIYFLLFLVIAFVIPSIRVYKQTGISPVTFGKSDNAHDYLGKVMKVLIAITMLSVILFSLQWGYQFLMPVYYIDNYWLRVFGLILLHAALLWVIIAQYQMKNSWRIGIDTSNETALITHGLFSFSRNPIFLGLIIAILGLFLIIPTAVNFTLLVVVYLVIQVQIRLEEEFLEKQHGTNYKHYRSKVRRLI